MKRFSLIFAFAVTSMTSQLFAPKIPASKRGHITQAEFKAIIDDAAQLHKDIRHYSQTEVADLLARTTVVKKQLEDAKTRVKKDPVFGADRERLLDSKLRVLNNDQRKLQGENITPNVSQSASRRLFN